MTEHRIRLTGTAPIVVHSAAGMDPRNAWNVEKARLVKKKASERTIADDERIQELECAVALWWDSQTPPCPTIPATALRAVIEASARKLKQGPLVREGLVIPMHPIRFEYDVKRYGSTADELCKTTQFTVPVVVGRARVMRTRAKFDEPWSVTFTADCDPELIDATHLATWLDIGGRRLGLGDWRPQKSGFYGTFDHELL